MPYPATKVTFTDPAGTSRVDTGVDHAQLHTDHNDTLEAVEDTLGTTAGTSVLKNFAAGDFAARINSSNTLQQALVGTLNSSVIGTPAITGGTITSSIINASVIGTPLINDGTINSVVKMSMDYQSNTTNSTKTGVFFQSGWGFMAGDSDSEINEAVTFPTAFGTVLGAQVTPVGYKDSSDPTSVGDTTGLLGVYLNCSAVSNTGLNVSITISSGIIPASRRVLYAWLAYGQ